MDAARAQSGTALHQHLGWDWTGRIHSVFRTSLNVDIDGLLLNIGQNPAAMPSLGLSLPAGDGQRLVEEMEVGDLVRSTASKLSLFPSRGVPMVKRWEDVRQVSRAVPFCSLHASDLAGLEAELTRLNLESRLGLELTDEARGHLANLTDSGVAAEDRRRTLTWLLGRGQGLTPSGDDILAGYAFVLWACGEVVIDAQVRVAARMRTTAVSATMLHMLSYGEVGSAVHAVWEAVRFHGTGEVENALAKVLEIGHSSGADTAYGMLLGVNYVMDGE